MSGSTRGVWAGGYTGSLYNTIDFVLFASAGTAGDFGDLSAISAEEAGLSNALAGAV